METKLLNPSPVKIGEVLHITPDGQAQKDWFLNYHGFIIFLKHVPKDKGTGRMSVEITVIKETYAFAEYLGDA